MTSGVYVRTKPARRISDAEKLHLRACHLGKPLSAEHRQKLSISHMGNPGHWTGKKRGLMPEAWKKKIQAAHKALGKNAPGYGHPPKWNKWVWYNGQHFRSSWEVRFAKALDSRGMAWSYESKTFDLGNTTYTPDFLTDDGVLWEVKGWLNDKSQQKIGLFRNLYPEYSLVVVTKPVLKLMENNHGS